MNSSSIMAEPISASNTSKRCAVVTGGNKGIGFEICRQLAGDGVMVVLTARNEQRGIEAVEKLRRDGFAHLVVFHQLDVVDPVSVSSLVQFVNTAFGKLDILVNNAGSVGVVANDQNALKPSPGSQINWKDVFSHSYELTAECFEINYYGSKRIIEAFLPLLQLSKSPRIVNVTSGWAKLENIKNEWAKGVLNNMKSLGEEVDEVVNQYLEDYKKGCLEDKGWPTFMSAYAVSKAAMNSYARITAHKYPSLQVNCVCPGYVKTDITYNTGDLTAEEGARSVVRVALQPEDGPSGVFFDRQQLISF